MSISRPFAYNPTQQTTGVEEQFGDLAVGFTGTTYGNSPGGLKWWNGPDEELGYVIGTSVPSGGPIAPDGTQSTVGFWRTNGFSDEQFIELSETLTGQNFNTLSESVQYLRSNGYWTSISEILQALYITGNFLTYYNSDNLFVGLGSLNSDGTINSNFLRENGLLSGQNNGGVRDIIVQPDNKILVGGGFDSYNGFTSSDIMRINSDGSFDNAFSGSVEGGEVLTMGLQSDGKIIIAGFFTGYNGISSNYIARLNTDGSYDSTFNVGVGFEANEVNTIAIQSDGKIMVGGNLFTYQGSTTKNILRLNSNASIDSTFSTGTGPTSGFDSSVRKISLLNDGRMICLGDFTQYRGTTANRIVRLNSDGTIDSTFNYGEGFDSITWDCVFQSDGKLIVIGGFSAYRNTSSPGIVRINTDGSLDTSFNVGTGLSIGYGVSIQSDGKIIVVGPFTQYSGISSNKIARLNTDGSYDSTFNIGNGFDNAPEKILLRNDNSLVIGGFMKSYNYFQAVRILSVLSNGELNSNFNQNIGIGFNSTVLASQVQTDGKVIVVGQFTTYKGISAPRIVRLNTDSSIDESFSVGSGFNNGAVVILSLQSDNKLLVGGSFSLYQNVSYNRIIRLLSNGSIDTTFNVGSGFNGIILDDIKIQSDGKIIVVGDFTQYSGISSNRIVRLNTDGSYDSSFTIGSGFNSNLSDVKIMSDGKILVAGLFTLYNSNSITNICRLNTNGSFDSSFTSPFNSGFINSIKIIDQDKILVGGTFSRVGNLFIQNFCVLNSDGSINNDFNNLMTDNQIQDIS